MIDSVPWHKTVSRHVLSSLEHHARGVEEAGVFAPFLSITVNVRASGQSRREGKWHTRN